MTGALGGILYSLIAYPIMIIVFFWYAIRFPKKWRFYIWIYVINLAIIAYSYEPLTTSDLTRYFDRLDTFAELPLSEVINWANNYIYITNIFFWIAAKTQCYGLLPSTAVAIVYGISSYISCDTAERYGKEYLIKYLLLLQFLFLPFFSIMNNVRNVIAFALALLAIYRDVVQGKRNMTTIILYIAPCFIHITAVTIIGLRVIIDVSRKLKPVIMILVLLLSNVIEFAYSKIHLVSSIPYLEKIIKLAYRYISNEYSQSEWATVVANSKWHTAYFYVIMIFALIVIVIVFKNEKEIRTMNCNGVILKNDADYMMIAFLIAVITLGNSIFYAPHYWRYGVALTIIMGHYFVMLYLNKKTYNEVLIVLLIFIGIAYFGLQLYANKAYISSIPNWFYNYLAFSPLRILYNIIIG